MKRSNFRRGPGLWIRVWRDAPISIVIIQGGANHTSHMRGKLLRKFHVDVHGARRSSVVSNCSAGRRYGSDKLLFADVRRARAVIGLKSDLTSRKRDVDHLGRVESEESLRDI